jgi:hypothetical protein
MAPANPVPQDISGGSARQPQSALDGAPSAAGGVQAEVQAEDVQTQVQTEVQANVETELVSQEELNAWRRGLTPQAEIWNGRLAMLGLSMGLLVLLLSRLISHPG